MAQKIREIMTRQPITLEDTATLMEAARTMRDANIGDVIVVRDGVICGVVTDRDIVIRAIAEGRDPKTAQLRDISTTEVATVAPDESVDNVINLMREKAVRRVPVVEAGRPVGVISIGDLALDKDKDSALAEISSAEPNK
jgi:CBS domain-containing protein